MNTPPSTPAYKNVTPTNVGDAELPAGKRRRIATTPKTPVDQPIPPPRQTPDGVRRAILVATPTGLPDPAGFPHEPRED